MSHRCQRICRVLLVAAWVPSAAATPIASDDASHDTRAGLTFGSDMPRLSSDSTLRRWVATDLSRQLGLSTAEHLEVDSRLRRLGDYQVLRLSQTLHGVPVIYRESRLLLDSESRPVHLLGHHSTFGEPPARRPRLSASQAASRAGGAPEHTSSWRLVFWPAADELRLGYELEGAFPDASEATAPFERVFVDASTGDVLHRLPLTRQALDREVHDFYAACREHEIDGLVDYPEAELLRIVSPLVRSETTRGGSRSVERLFAILGSIHSFFDLVLDRDSFDGAGATLRAYHGTRFFGDIPWQQCIGDEFNAGWTGENFMLVHRDAVEFPAIIAHEVTHGLINATADLDYQGQSGALDEAISDALGVTFDAWRRSGAARDVNAPVSMTSSDWQMRLPSGVARDMSNPRSVSWGPPGQQRPYPDHYDDYADLPLDVDHGGVHINSSIINHGFYLLAQGGRHRSRAGGPDVEGIGAMRAARIFGRAAELLTPQSNFRNARVAFAFVAESLHGPGSPEWVSVHTAMDAIGVPGTWDPPRPTPPEPDPPPTRPQTTPPEPDPPPTRPQPDPDPPEDDDSDAAGPESDDPSGDNAVLVMSLVGGLMLLRAAGLMLRPRPPRSPAPAPGRQRRPVRPGSPSGGAQVAPPTPAPTPKPEGDVVLGVLRPVDGSRPIPLPVAQLSSREGLVVGRDIELCHVQIRHSSVSRRHVRLRVQELTGSRLIQAEDMNSLRGTRIDEVDLKPFQLESIMPGQILRIAGLAYRMEREVTLRFRP